MSSMPSFSSLASSAQGVESQYAPYLERVRWMLRRYALVVNVAESLGPQEDPATHVAFRGLSGAPLPDRFRTTLEALDACLAESYESIAQRSAGVETVERFETLRRQLSLSDLECDALWLLVASELVPDVLWLQRTLWADKSRRLYDRTFLVHVLDPCSRRLAAVFAALSPSAPLRAQRLIVPLGDAAGHSAPAPEEADQWFAPAQRVVGFLLGVDTGLPRSPGLVALHEPPGRGEGGAHGGAGPRVEPSSAATVAPDEGADGESELSMLSLAGDDVRRRLQLGFRRARRFVIFGPDNAGPLPLAREVMHSQDAPLLEVDVRALLEGGEAAVVVMLGEARLRHAGLYLDRIEALGAEGVDATLQRRMFELLSTVRVPLFFRAPFGLRPALRLRLVRDLEAIEIRLRLPEPEVRERIWRSRLSAHFSGEALAQLAYGARTFLFGPGEIDAALELAWLQARGRHQSAPRLRATDVEQACVALSSQAIGQFARRVEVRAGWQDVVLVPQTRHVIDEIIRFGRHARHVLEEQGYGKRMAYGRGVTALFYGPSGTGKTLLSGLVARELGLELYAIDLSQVVSKYIGETEQRLSEIFDEAEAGGMALLFDEADSLFAGRTEVKSSVDRYANLEVNYLLQRLEKHDGVVFLTTNFPKSIDEAFMRRIRFKAEFPAPGPEERKKLWLAMIPRDAPVEADLELDELSRSFELTGGEIRNALLRAAFYAADESRPLAYEHLERACRVEYREAGRLLADAHDGDDW